MNEYLLALTFFWAPVIGGGLIGGAIGYLLGRYRIKIRRVVEDEEPEKKESLPLFLRKIMD